MIFVAAFVLALSLAQGKIYDRCELARELKFVHQAPDHQLATWVCIAEHESQYNTSIVGHLNGDGSGDHGIFQISDQFWCSPPNKGMACGLTCAELEDDDISDDFLCAQRIYKEHKHLSGDGFNAWAVYKPHCKGPKADRYLKDCFGGSEEPKSITTTGPVAAHGFFNTAAGRTNKGFATSTRKPVSEPYLNFRKASVVESNNFALTNPQVNSFFAPRSSVFLNSGLSTSTENPSFDFFFTPTTTTTFRPTTTTTTFTPFRSSTGGSSIFNPTTTTAFSPFRSSTSSLTIFNPTTTVRTVPTTRRPTFFGQTFSTPSTTTRLFTPTVSSPVYTQTSSIRPIFIINGVKWY